MFTTLVLAAVLLLVAGCSRTSPAENSSDVRNAAAETMHPDLGSLPRSRLFVGSGPNHAALFWWENLGDGRLQGEMRVTEKLEPDEDQLDGQPREAVFASYTSYFVGFRDGRTLVLDVRSRVPYAPAGEWTGELLRDVENADASQLPALRLRDLEDEQRLLEQSLLFPADSEQAYAEAVARLTQGTE